MSFFHNNALAGASGQTTGGDDAYQIEKSLRFNDDDSPSLERYISTSGNRSTWTWSGWVKKSNISSDSNLITQGIFYCGTDGNNREGLLLLNDNTLAVAWRSGGTTNEQLTLAPLFRDASAWLHVVWSFDYNVSGTSPTGKSKIYINGKLIEDYGSGADAFSATVVRKMNEAGNTFYIGKQPAGDQADVLLADVHFIDGLALSPAAFGSFDSTGVWNPKAFALPAPNDGTTWSGQVSGSFHSSDFNATKAFDGNASGSWAIPAAGTNVTWTPTSTITANSSIRVHFDKNGTGGPFKQNGSNIRHLVADGWVELPERTITELIWGSDSANNQAQLMAVEVDGVILVDGQTDPTNKDWINQPGFSHTSSLSATDGGSFSTTNDVTQSVTMGWGNVVDDWVTYTRVSPATGDFKWTVPSHIQAINCRKLRFFIYVDANNASGATFKLNGSNHAVTGWSGQGFFGWVEFTDPPSTLTSLEYSPNSNGISLAVKAIEFNGVILQNNIGPEGANGFHLKFNDTSLNRYLGKDTLNGKIADATGGLPIYNTTDDYGDVKGSGYRADSSAGTTNNTGLVLAVPGDSVASGTCDVHQAINTGSSNKAVTTNGSIAVKTDQSRLYGSSLYFDDSDDYINFADDADWDISTGDYCIEAWVRWETVANDETILGCYAGNNAWQVFTGNGGAYPAFQIRQSDNTYKEVYSSTVVAANQWYHLACTVEGTNIKLYLNGILKGTTAFSGTVKDCDQVVQIGSRVGGTSNKFNGWINDLRIYKGTAKYTANFKPPTRNDFTVNNLTHNDGGVVIGSSTGGIPILTTTDNPNYGETTGGSVDTSDANKSDIILAISGYSAIADVHHTVKGSGSALTLSAGGSGADPAISTTSSRLYGNSIYFAGANHIKVPHSSTFQFGSGSSGSTSNDFTWEFWMNPSSVSGLRGIVGGRGDGGGNNGALLMLAHASLQLNFPNNDPGLNYEGVQVGTWYHVAISRNENNLRLFVNGNLIETITGTDTIDLYPSSSHWYIGDSNYGSGTSLGPYQGYIQDFRMYTTAKYTSSFTVPTLPVPENIDSLTDSPTNYGTDTGAGGEVRGNYCNWNPLAKAASVTLSNGNLQQVGTAAWDATMGTFGVNTGKWYYEVTMTSGTYSVYGVADASNNDLGTDPYNNAKAVTYIWDSGKVCNGDISSPLETVGTSAAGDVVGIAFDADAKKVWFLKNGTSLSGTPGSSGGYTLPTAAFYTPFGDCYSATTQANFGQRPFEKTVPSGFKALCTQNLNNLFDSETSENNPSKYFDVTTWVGDGSSPRTITQANGDFTPDLVWLKNRTTAGRSHYLYDAVRTFAAQKELVSNSTDEEGSSNHQTQNHGYVSGVGAGTFTLGAGATNQEYTNKSGDNFVAWNWDAGTAVTNYGASDNGADIACAVWKNTTAGFSIVKWTSNAGSSTAFMNHGLGAQPGFVLIKNLTTASSWIVLHDGLGTDSNSIRENHLVLNTTGAMVDKGSEYFERANNNVFGLRHDIISSSSSDEMIAYLWTAIPGFSHFGGYEGTGTADGPFMYTGFKPKWLLLKCADGHNWVLKDTARNLYNPSNGSLLADGNQAETDWDIHVDILSNGFKLKGASESNTNKSGENHIYCAFAESPFKTSRAR